MNRGDHLQWAKDRALQYVAVGDMNRAFASLGSDLNEHDELRNHSGLTLGTMLLMAGKLGTAREMRKFIVGFN